MDTEKAAARRANLLFKMPREEANWEDYREIIENAEQDHEPIRYPQNFDWDLIKDVPLSLFPEATVSAVKNVGDAEERREHKERIGIIVKMLKKGADPWPVIVDSEGGVIVDGWHRLAALHQLKASSVDVLYV